MARCAYCGTVILFGGVRDGNLRFCSKECHQQGYALTIAPEIPEDVIEQLALETHQGFCPQCGGRGPVDVHMSHRVYSVLVYTKWSSRANLCCRSCGLKRQIADAVFSLFFGWWSSWGLVLTPVQVIRNFTSAIRPPDEMRPSQRLREFLRIRIASNLLLEQRAAITEGSTKGAR